MNFDRAATEPPNVPVGGRMGGLAARPGGDCAFADGSCRGRMDHHHVVEQQWIKGRFPHGAVWDRWRGRLVPLERGHHIPLGVRVELEDLLEDRRNLLVVCRHHHDRVTGRRVYVTPSAEVWEFAGELGLEGRLVKQQERAA